MNLVTLIGKIKNYDNSENLTLEIDDKNYSVIFDSNTKKDNFVIGDIVGIIGMLDRNNNIKAKYISTF